MEICQRIEEEKFPNPSFPLNSEKPTKITAISHNPSIPTFYIHFNSVSSVKSVVKILIHKMILTADEREKH